MDKKAYYILKIKGKAKIPDYIQLRDEHFTLIGYFRPDREEKILKTIDNEAHVEKIKSVIQNIPYGKIERVEL